jgi:excisionase family DNA binding protein
MVPSGEDKIVEELETRPVPINLDLKTEPLWTTDDVASYLRLEPETVRAMTRGGKLPGFKVGRVWRYRRREIRSWLHEKGS